MPRRLTDSVMVAIEFAKATMASAPPDLHLDAAWTQLDWDYTYAFDGFCCAVELRVRMRSRSHRISAICSIDYGSNTHGVVGTCIVHDSSSGVWVGECALTGYKVEVTELHPPETISPPEASRS